MCFGIFQHSSMLDVSQHTVNLLWRGVLSESDEGISGHVNLASSDGVPGRFRGEVSDDGERDRPRPLERERDSPA